jgi:hypothetical protein
VQRFEAEVLKNRSRLFDLRQQVVQTENRINLLVGRPPQPIARRAAALHEPLPSQLGAGLPSQLLENRPDIRQAQLQLEASKLDVASARAAFFPALSLEAGLGYGAFNPVHLLATPESLLGNLAGNLVAPLLNRAGLEAQYRAAHARQLQAVFTYERALLQAFTAEPSVLFASQSFWEGVDVPGEALSLVAMDKLPFASPGDPLVAARIRRLEERGEEPFNTLQLPQAALALKQGFGRLIRTRDDRGIVAILDSRLYARGYGRALIASLPPARQLHRVEALERWFRDGEL